MFWIDFEGQEKRYAKLPPGGEKVISTFETHSWVVRDAQSRQVGAAVAGAAPMTLRVGEP